MNTAAHASTATADTMSLDLRQASSWERLVEPMARLGTPSDTPEEAHRLRFLQAGLRQRGAPVAFYATKVGLALGLPLVIGAMLWAWSGLPSVLVSWGIVQAAASAGTRPLSGMATATLLLTAAAMGAVLPEVWLRRRTAQRQRELFEALPDSIDLLVVCLEAGLGLDAALERVQRDLALRSPALADELEVLGSELRLGHAREQALRQLAQRTGIEEAQRLVATLVQADRFGLGMADALRAHAQDLRLRRQVRAEEEAAKMPVKLLFPLIFALFPSLMVVLLGPAVIGVMRQMLPLMAGG